jgi:hypothetical protein
MAQAVRIAVKAALAVVIIAIIFVVLSHVPS